MIKSMQRCQNCRFFKRTWEKVEKSEYVPVYRAYHDLTEREKRSGTYERPYGYDHDMIWHEYERRDRGVCRRYPPQLTATSYHGVSQLLPDVNANHYCGEWRPILESGNISAYTEE